MSNMIGNMVARLMSQKIEEFRTKMTVAGLERWLLKKYEVKYSLEDPNMFNVNLMLKKILFTGLTQFVVEKINFDVNTSELTFNLVIPKLFVSIGNSLSKMSIFHKDCQAECSGFVTIFNLRVNAQMKLDINQNGMEVTIISQKTSVEKIESKVKLMVLGFDLSFLVDNFLINILPTLLDTFMNYLKQPIEAALKLTLDRQFVDMF